MGAASCSGHSCVDDWHAHVNASVVFTDDVHRSCSSSLAARPIVNSVVSCGGSEWEAGAGDLLSQEECVVFRSCMALGECGHFKEDARSFDHPKARGPLPIADILADSLFTGDSDDVMLIIRQHTSFVPRTLSTVPDPGPPVVLGSHTTQTCVLEGERMEQQLRAGSNAIEFKARTLCGDLPADEDRPVVVRVLVNRSIVLADNVSLSSYYRVYRYVCDIKEPIWSVSLELHGSRGAELDKSFGLRLRGEDLLHMTNVEAKDSDWCLNGADRQAIHQDARQGFFVETPARYIAEAAITFMAHGLSGKEQIDVFVNGLSIPCELGVSLGSPADAPLLLRFVLAPASCSIRTVVIRVTSARVDDAAEDSLPARALHCTADMAGNMRREDQKAFGVVLDSDFGVMVAGMDCLPSAIFITPDMDMHDGPVLDMPSGVSQEKIEAGEWLWKGLYVLLPYKRTKKPYNSQIRRSQAPRRDDTMANALCRNSPLEDLAIPMVLDPNEVYL